MEGEQDERKKKNERKTQNTFLMVPGARGKGRLCDKP